LRLVGIEVGNSELVVGFMIGLIRTELVLGVREFGFTVQVKVRVG